MPHAITLLTVRIQGIADADPDNSTKPMVLATDPPTPADDRIGTAILQLFWSAGYTVALQSVGYGGGMSTSQPANTTPTQYSMVWTAAGTPGATGDDSGNWLEGYVATTPTWNPVGAYEGVVDPGTQGLHILDDAAWDPNALQTTNGVTAVPMDSAWAAVGMHAPTPGVLSHYPQLVLWGVKMGTPDAGTYSSFSCFMHGTIFRTLKDNTEVPIEIQNLKVGDLVKTEVFVNQKECQFSQEGWQRVKGTIQRGLTADQYAEKTVILPKDAFGEGKPEKDLHVTWGHGLLLKEMKEEWKNEEYDGNHGTYSKTDALVKGDFIKLLAGHCSLCRKPNEEEKKKAKEESERRVYHHLQIEDDEERSQHALLSNGLATESLV